MSNKPKQRSTPEARDEAQKREMLNRVTELYVWLGAALVFSGGVLLDGWRYATKINYSAGPWVTDLLVDHYGEIIGAFCVFAFPIVFRTIFGMLPLESLRRKRLVAQRDSALRDAPRPADAEVLMAETELLNDELSIKELAEADTTTLFAYYASSSKRLAENIYNRAGIYLLTGVFVAFSGLAFFYLQTTQLPSTLEGASLLLTLAPKFGILFFIELVAMFFLRQYRSAMDEFRFYEGIKRKREETLALIRLALLTGKPIDPLELVKSESFFSKSDKLSKDESTEIIESRKLEKHELDLLEKVIDVVSNSSKK